MYRENMSYQDKVNLMADMWTYNFNHEMTQQQIRDFHKECEAYEVNVIDVLAFITDFGR